MTSRAGRKIAARKLCLIAAPVPKLPAPALVLGRDSGNTGGRSIEGFEPVPWDIAPRGWYCEFT